MIVGQGLELEQLRFRLERGQRVAHGVMHRPRGLSSTIYPADARKLPRVRSTL